MRSEGTEDVRAHSMYLHFIHTSTFNNSILRSLLSTSFGIRYWVRLIVRVPDSGFRVSDSGYRISGLEFMVWNGFMVEVRACASAMPHNNPQLPVHPSQ